MADFKHPCLKLWAFNFGHPCPSLVKGEVLSPTKIRATTGGIAFRRTEPLHSHNHCKRTTIPLPCTITLASTRKRVRFCCSVKPSQLWWGLLPICTINEIFRTIPLAFRRLSVCVCLVGFASIAIVVVCGRCVLHRLFATTCKHPCLKPLGTHAKASLPLYERSVGFASLQSLWVFISGVLALLAPPVASTLSISTTFAKEHLSLALLAPPVAPNTSIPTTIAKPHYPSPRTTFLPYERSVGFASMPRQPFVPLHLCIDSHLCRCICASTAICAVASCNGFVWLSLCILA